MSKRFLASRLFIALDFTEGKLALELAKTLSPLGVGFKIGMQLYYAEGPAIIQALKPFSDSIFVDLKLHDIPNTVSGAVDSLVRGGATLINVHTQGGTAMMRAAVTQAKTTAEALTVKAPSIVGVTVLTSLNQQVLSSELGVNAHPLNSYVVHLAGLARQNGLDGVVCSAHEAPLVEAACGQNFLRITPGIRPAGSAVNDQSRSITPVEALNNGATHLVIGRPITTHKNPLVATEKILTEINALTAV
ncbi:MAG: orotidine-5'-phosphate decarboxylase [Cyanobacteria bacterium P01_H01_bin.74]